MVYVVIKSSNWPPFPPSPFLAKVDHVRDKTCLGINLAHRETAHVLKTNDVLRKANNNIYIQLTLFSNLRVYSEKPVCIHTITHIMSVWGN